MKRKYTTFPFKDITGNEYGKLSVIDRAANKNNGTAHWNCICTCGNLKVISGTALRYGSTVSCGCVARDKNKRLMAKLQEGNDGKTKHELYETWRKMIARCYDPAHAAYKNYGQRGIKVCDRWLNNFWNFVADMHPRPIGLTLERKDNDAGYNKENCTWATYKEQNNNRRIFRVCHKS